MCGIVTQSIVHRLAPHFDEAVNLIRHRGTELPVVTESPGGVFAHVRLPIVGLDPKFSQPVRRVGSAGNWTIGFVGEVLDFRERNPKLECDLEVVTRAWLQKGPKGLMNHDGFWSVVALADSGDLHMVCDYLGQKPMYYRQDMIACASEPDAVAALHTVTPDEIYLAAVIKWGYCPEIERTPYREVKRVLPGEHVVIQANHQIRRRIVDPLEPLSCTKDELKAEIEAAVRRRVLSSDVPVACLLSGGLDSSIVYTLAKRYGNVKAYYASDERRDTSEELAVAAVAGRDSVTELFWGSVDLTDALRIMQEPIDLGSLIPQVALSRIVKERVCLTGDGADECFGGYGRAERYDSQASDLFQELPAWHLPRLDRVMMRHCIEVRSPFLARRVVQMAMGLPRELRVDKMILRDIFRDDLPPTIAYRKKKPLRTSAVEDDRESISKKMVEQFRRDKWPEHQSADPVLRMFARM
jgi:asparagine synthase (glutamine-hydrolysing)